MTKFHRARAVEQRNSEAIARINYLYQLAHTAHHNPALQRLYSAQLKQLAQRIVFRLHTGVKNSICKRCNTLLGSGAAGTVEECGDNVRVRRRCQLCGFSKLIDTRPPINTADNDTVTQTAAAAPSEPTGQAKAADTSV